MMQLPDTNLLLYAVHADSPSHPRARQALEAMLDGPGMALCWLALAFSGGCCWNQAQRAI